MRARLFPTIAAVVVGSLTMSAQHPWSPDTPEPGSVEAIGRFTTEPRFLSPWVAYVPDSATVPSPTKYLGHLVGAPGELSNTAKIYGYFRALAKATPRVVVQTIGKSDEGREILLVAVADEAGIRDMSRFETASAALADPRVTSPDEAERVIAGTRPFYYFNAGLHSSETGSPEMVMELVYRLAVSEQPMIKAIRSNVIVLVNPVSEPDGRDRYVDWFYRYLKGKTDYEDLPPDSPPYWGRYVFHDNNRDAHQRALETTRAVQGVFHKYHPVVVHDLHESIALLQTWNGTGPWNPNLDPIVVSEFFDMSFAEVREATTFGMPGVWTWAFGEGFGHHYMESVATNHNAIGRGYETFGNGSAETMARNLRDRKYVGRPVTDKEWYRPLPPPRKFTWSLRNNTNYMETGCLAILNYAANNAKDMLRAFYRKGYNSWQKGVTGKPFAFAIPEDQGDPRRVAELVNLLRDQRIEVSRATSDVSVKEGTFPRGTFVVRLDQPYRNYALDLLAPQKFPANAEYQPYDDISWALPVHYGLQATRIDDERVKDVPLEPVTAPVQPAGRVAGDGPVFLLRDSGQEALLAARSRLASWAIDIAEKPFKAGGADFPAGSWIIAGQPGVRPALDQVARELALVFESTPALPDVARHAATIPRLAVWHPWADTQAIGWIRYTLDREKVPYTYIRDDDIRAGNLESRFDVIVWGDVELDLQEQIHGIDRKYSPLALYEDAGLSLARPARRVGRHHGWNRVERDGEPAALRGTGGRADDARQRLGAGARRRAGARRGPGARRRQRVDARRGADDEVHPARASDRVRVPTCRFRVPSGLSRLQRASCGQAMGGAAVGHAPAEGGSRSGRSGARAGRSDGVERGSEGGRRARGAARGARRARREGTRDRVQLQPAPPRAEPVGLPPVVECGAELARARRVWRARRRLAVEFLPSWCRVSRRPARAARLLRFVASWCARSGASGSSSPPRSSPSSRCAGSRHSPRQ